MIASDDEDGGWEAPTCDEFTILKTLGEGKTSKVKLAKDPDGKLVAIKRFKEDMLVTPEYLDDELKFMELADHPNILRLIAVRKKAIYTNQYGQKYQCFCIVIQFAGGGDLFEYVAQSGPFKPNLCRTYFMQLMHGVQHIHKKGICHRDLKLENVLLSNDFELKIADFGFATFLQGPGKDFILKDKLGTEGYMAPEIMLCKYKGTEVDIFACGVILFILYSGNPPFQRALVTDPFYKTIKERQYSVFWEAHSKNKPVDFFTDDFKDLFVRMVAYKPQERIKLEEILEHPWCLKTILTQEKVVQEMEERKQKVTEINERIRKEKEAKRIKRRETIEKHLSEETKQIAAEDIEGVTCKLVQEVFLKTFKQETCKPHPLQIIKILKATDYVIKEDECFFFTSLYTYLDELREGFVFTVKFADIHEFRVKQYQQLKDQVNIFLEYLMGGNHEQIQLRLQILKFRNYLVLRFTKVSGNFLFYKRFTELIKQEFLYCHIKRCSKRSRSKQKEVSQPHEQALVPPVPASLPAASISTASSHA